MELSGCTTSTVTPPVPSLSLSYVKGAHQVSPGHSLDVVLTASKVIQRMCQTGRLLVTPKTNEIRSVSFPATARKTVF
jgi:hypothetical protein